jgi:hypothetical protein
VIAKSAIANGAAIENAAEFTGYDTFRRPVGIYRSSGHLHILVLPHKILEEIARAAFIVGNQNFHARGHARR